MYCGLINLYLIALFLCQSIGEISVSDMSDLGILPVDVHEWLVCVRFMYFRIGRMEL